jgi:hypothetical protein
MEKQMSNIEFSYLYRDGGNYKKWGRVVFSNPDGINTESVERKMRQAFLEDGIFIASQIRIPEVFLYAGGKFSSDDHCYHEFNGVQPTTSRADDTHRRSIGEFLVEVTQEARRGWQVFDPYDSEGSYGFLTSRTP